MKKLTKLIIILAVALLVISCSEDGKLTVINKSSEQIDVIIDGTPYNDLSYNEESETETWSIAFGDEKNVPITATGYWLLDYSYEVTIGPGDDVLHEINSNCGKLTVINKSSEQIDVTIDDTPYYDLSYNEESETETWSIAFGDEKNVPITATGYWLLDYSDEVTIGPGDDVLHEINSNCGKIQISNNHPSLSIWYVYLSVSTATEWGDDQLGSDIIAPGETYAWFATSGYTWDVKIVDGNSDSYEIYGDETLGAEETISYTFSASANIVPNVPIKTKYKDVVRKKTAQPNVSVEKIGKVK